jgi:hypothetical protein
MRPVSYPILLDLQVSYMLLLLRVEHDREEYTRQPHDKARKGET